MPATQASVEQQPACVERSLDDTLLDVRAEIRQCFDELSAKLTEEIKGLRLLGTSSPFNWPQFSEIASHRTQVSSGPSFSLRTELTSALGFGNHATQPQQLSPLPESVATATAQQSQKDDAALDVRKNSTSTSMPANAGTGALEDGSDSGDQQATRVSSRTWKDAISNAMKRHHNTILQQVLSKLVHDLQKKRAIHYRLRQQILYRIVHSSVFTSFCTFLIALNAIWMGYESDSPSSGGGDWVVRVSQSFNIWFIIELTLKITAFRTDFLIGHDWMWNLLDTACVIVSIPDFFAPSINMSFLRLVRLARLTRAVRLVRLLRFLRSLREILMTVFYTMGSLLWSFVAILFVAYIFSLVFVQSLNLHEEAGTSFSHDTSENFENVWSSMMALFSMISGGQDWYPIALDLKNNEAYLAHYLLEFWIFFMQFGLINVVLAVFCSQAEEAREARTDLRIEKDKEKQARNIGDLIEIFHMIDDKREGAITWNQFHEFARTVEGQHLLQSHRLTLFALEDMWDIMNDYDDKEDGQVDITCFVMGCTRLSNDSLNSNLLLLTRELEQLHRDNNRLHKDHREMIQELRFDMDQVKSCFGSLAEQGIRERLTDPGGAPQDLKSAPPGYSL